MRSTWIKIAPVWFMLARAIVALNAAPTEGALFNQDSHQSKGFGIDAARVDSQITLRIPDGQAQAVYEYLRRTYAESEAAFRTQFPDLALRGDPKIDVSEFTDVYFDTRDLALLGTQNTIRFRTRVNTTNPADRKSGRRLVQIKFTPPGRFDLRTELKFEIKPSHRFRDMTDQHPLFRLVDRPQRPDLLDAINRMGVSPFELRQSITLRQTRSRIYVYWDNQNVLSFSVDEYRTRALWTSVSISSIDIGLVENVYTGADEAKRRQLWAIRNQLVADLRRAFPALEQNSSEKYSLALGQLLEGIPGFRFLIRYGLL